MDLTGAAHSTTTFAFADLSVVEGAGFACSDFWGSACILASEFDWGRAFSDVAYADAAAGKGTCLSGAARVALFDAAGSGPFATGVILISVAFRSSVAWGRLAGAPGGALEPLLDLSSAISTHDSIRNS